MSTDPELVKAIVALNKGLHSVDNRLKAIQANTLSVARDTAAIRTLLGGAIALWVVLLVVGAVSLLVTLG